MAKTKEQVAQEIKTLLKENGMSFKINKKFEEYRDMNEYSIEVHVVEEAKRFEFSPQTSFVWREWKLYLIFPRTDHNMFLGDQND